ncbi:hypothetical protein LB467_16515 [Salegentibacter sp. JZCK2]|uniref:hypothetical protein n=1 Tax=Salegentibacter tibetensis TaxID=2873600 RepID=UPI001CCB05D3|nr:hypothetical protein [Salegentibacter tibetensis]MBZ9731295.1 hypothetical protein [Salegentibacter tibetensis]
MLLPKPRLCNIYIQKPIQAAKIIIGVKITFLCGCLEPGRDGVGDYTLRLAMELIKNGHKVSIVSLNDHFLPKNSFEVLEQNLIPVIRVRLGNKQIQILSKVKRYIEEWDPEWLSLQFVPFSFHKKGLPIKLASQLNKLGKGRRWHIMFHELWVGMDNKDSFKLKLLGSLQKHIVKKTIDILVPEIINTHTRLYLSKLDKMGCKSDLLPLFGNIPILFQSEEKRNGIINIAVFGGIHPGAKLKKFINEVPKANKYKFHFIGSNGPEQGNWVATLTKNNVDYQLHGWLGIEEISKILSKCQWGVTSTPYYLSEKSGSTAAMLEHNLIVFCIARKWNPRDIKVEVLANDAIIKWKTTLDMESFIKCKRYKSENNIEVIAENFINRLKTKQV